MNKWKTTFVFITGILLMHLVGHIAIALEGMLPYTSRTFGFTLTSDLNTVVIVCNAVLLLVCGYFAFLHDWETRLQVHRHV